MGEKHKPKFQSELLLNNKCQWKVVQNLDLKPRLYDYKTAAPLPKPDYIPSNFPPSLSPKQLYT